MEDKQKYFFVPIQLLRGLHADKKKTLRDCAMYGVYSLTQTKEVTGKDDSIFIKQFLYDFYRTAKIDKGMARINSDERNIFADNSNGALPDELMDMANEYVRDGELTVNVDRNGFNRDGGFTAEDGMDEMKKIFKNDPYFEGMVVDYGKFRYAFNFYGMKKDFKKIYDWAMETEKQIPPKSPMVMIGQDKLREFFEDDTKTEFEVMTFAVYLAIRSILGEDKMKFTTKDMILARAFGFRNIKELKKNPPDLYEKYSKRYWMDKCLGEIRGGWNIITYSSNRDGLHGIYVANGYDITKKELLRRIEKKRKAKDSKSHNAEMKKLRDEVRKELNYDG
jgi:hypothetical protein